MLAIPLLSCFVAGVLATGARPELETKLVFVSLGSFLWFFWALVWYVAS